MKKVFFNTPVGVNIEKIHNKSIIGIIFNTNGKNWIVRIGLDSYVAINTLTTSIVANWSESSVKKYCEEASRIDGEVFVFDTKEELSNWIKS